MEAKDWVWMFLTAFGWLFVIFVPISIAIVFSRSILVGVFYVVLLVTLGYALKKLYDEIPG